MEIILKQAILVFSFQLVTGILRLSCGTSANFNIVLDGMADTGTIENKTTSDTSRQCSLNCASMPGCKSLNYKKITKQCELFDRGILESIAWLQAHSDSVYMATDEKANNLGHTCTKLSPCHNGAKCENACNNLGYRCICKQFYFGTNCEKLIQDCTSIKNSGKTQSGVYEIRASPDYTTNVFCNLETGSKDWIVIQRRVNASVDFYRNWASYKAGFGDVAGNFWIGLEKMHKLAGPGRGAILRIDIKHRKNPNQAYFARYSAFEIGDESTGYRILIDGYSGTAGDPMLYHNKMKFTTYDRDNDRSGSENCAQRWKGGWWHKTCHRANLNGWYPTTSTTNPSYMSWYDLYSSHGNVIYSEMKIKYYRSRKP